MNYIFLHCILIDIVQLNLATSKKTLKLFKFKNVSDFRKEKSILYYSKLLFISSFKIFLLLIFIFVFIFILNLLSNSFLNLAISILGMIEFAAVFIIYHLLRKKIYAKL